MKQRYVTTEKKDKSKEQPMTQAALFKLCEWTLPLSEGEMKSWWDELHDDTRIERDNTGFRGRLQL